MQIKLGDTIRDDRGREGVITNIGIATDPADIGGELELTQKNMILIWIMLVQLHLVVTGVILQTLKKLLKRMSMLKTQHGWEKIQMLMLQLI